MNLQRVKAGSQVRIEPASAGRRRERCSPARSLCTAAYNIGSKIHTMSSRVSTLADIVALVDAEIAESPRSPSSRPVEEIMPSPGRFGRALEPVLIIDANAASIVGCALHSPTDEIAASRWRPRSSRRQA
jgi:hypothetical protein